MAYWLTELLLGLTQYLPAQFNSTPTKENWVNHISFLLLSICVIRFLLQGGTIRSQCEAQRVAGL